jgi:arylsulfatase A-like enzyme
VRPDLSLALVAALVAGLGAAHDAPSGRSDPEPTLSGHEVIATRQGGRPALVVVLAVDQMRGDYLDRFRGQLTGGLARLVREGAWFADAHQDIAISETSPGHATILSGRYPNSHGIAHNEEGVGDPSAPLLEVEGPGASPRRFRGSTLVDWLAAGPGGSRALSVSRKDRSAILMTGRARQHVYWYEQGRFTTSTYYADTLPEWVRGFNARGLPSQLARRDWTLLLPETEYAEPDHEASENGGVDFVFPHRIPEDTPSTVASFKVMPWMDDVVAAFALEGVARLGLGRGAGTDVLVVGFSATDNIGHSFGPDSREIHDQILRVDRLLGSFLDSLARLVDSRRGIVVALTSDHGVSPVPERRRARGDTSAERVSLDELAAETQRALERRVGPGRWAWFSSDGYLALDRAALEARGVPVDSVVEALAAAARRHRGVLRADTRRTLAAADTARDHIARRWLHALPPRFEAEVTVTLAPHRVWAGGTAAARHGQPHDDDTHVALVLWGRGVRRGLYRGRVSVADLAPTLARLTGVEPSEPVQGRVLREALSGGRAP